MNGMPEAGPSVPRLRSPAYYWATHQAHRLQVMLGRWRQAGGPSRGGVRIVGYHRVTREQDELAVPPEVFRAQMEVLGEIARPLSLDDVPAVLAGPVDELHVCVTLDDGYHDNLTNAVPVLRELGIPATIFVPTAVIDGSARLYWYDEQPRVLSWSELRELSRDGAVSIGAHTRSHPNLTALSDAEAWEEIAGCKEDLEQQLGSPVTSFAYPAGFVGEREAQLVVKAGYSVGLTTQGGHNDGATPLACLNRNFIDRRDDVSMFIAKIGGLLDSPWSIQQLRAKAPR